MEDLGEGDLIILEGFIRDRFTKVFPNKATLVDIAQYCKGGVFADTVVNSQKRLMDNNFVPLDRSVVYEIYESLYK